MKFLTLFTRYIFLGALVLATLPAQAQEPERDQLQKEFEAFRQQTNARFNNFRDSVDRAFVRFMRDSWKDFAVYAGNPSPLSPDKPTRQPNAPETTPKSATPDRPGTEISGSVVASAPPDDEADFRPAPPDQEGEPVSEVIYRTADIGFYGLNLPLRYDLGMVLNLSRPFNKSIPDGWEVLASTDYNALIMQLVTVSDKTRLNDWGYVQLVRKMATALYPAQYNEQVLFTCFILNKSGYLAKIGFNRQALFLLLPSPQEVYNTPYLTIENRRYYVYSFNPDYGHVASIKTYEGQYGDSRHAVNFAFKNPVHLPKNIQTRAVRLSKDAPETIEVQYNKNLVDFYQDMPPTGFAVTLSTPLSEVARASFRTALEPLLEDKTAREKVDVLLRLVQYGFEYQTDQEQFGREKYFFPEEVLYFPYADCEDRSALFAQLVKEMTGLEVIGLVFPEHVATAVRFSEDFPGDYVTYEGQKYLICDPTYIGAGSGMVMPKYKNAAAQMVLLD